MTDYPKNRVSGQDCVTRCDPEETPLRICVSFLVHWIQRVSLSTSAPLDTFTPEPTYLYSSFFSPSRGPHPWPEAPALQRDVVSAAEGGAGQDKEEAAGQRRALHLGDGRGQVHAALLPHRLLALLWEAQWRLVMAEESLLEAPAWYFFVYSMQSTFYHGHRNN